MQAPSANAAELHESSQVTSIQQIEEKSQKHATQFQHKQGALEYLRVENQPSTRPAIVAATTHVDISKTDHLESRYNFGRSPFHEHLKRSWDVRAPPPYV